MVVMGFQIPKRTAVLTFEDMPEFAGCEIRISLDISWEDYFFFDSLSEAGPEKLAEAIQKFGDNFLESWNLVDDQGDLPASGDSLMKLPPWVATLLINKWREAMEVAASTDGPLGKPSPNGSTGEGSNPASSRKPGSSSRSARGSGSR